MWEITLVGKEIDYPYFLELEKKILDLKINSIVSIGLKDDLFISICSQNKILSKIERYIFETIIKINKSEYMLENLDFLSGGDSLYDSFMLSSIVNLDLDMEVDFAKYYAKLDKSNNIRSFFRFKLNKLTKSWQGILVALNMLFADKEKERIYLDFLKYLTVVTKPLYDVVVVNQSLRSMVVMDKYGNTLKKVYNNDEVDTLVNLIMYLPKKIIVKSSNVGNKIFAMIKYIFDDKVSVVL